MNENNTENKKENIIESEKKEESVSVPLLIANITLMGFVISFGFMIYQTKQEKAVALSQEKKVNVSAFENLNLEAKSVFVWDVINQKAIFSKDDKTVRPLASLTKIMTAITALSILPKNSIVTVKKEFLSEEGDSGLYVNEKWSLKDLLNFSLLVSSNDGMHGIASVAGAFGLGQNMEQPNYDTGLKAFVIRMNSMALQIGLPTMHFNNETGLDQSVSESGGYGSAYDMAKLMEYAMKKYPNILEATKDQSETIFSFDKKHIAKNTDLVVSKIPNLIGSKTGYTALSGGNLVVAFDAGIGRSIIISVLGSTYDGRFTDMQKLASSTLRYIREND